MHGITIQVCPQDVVQVGWYDPRTRLRGSMYFNRHPVWDLMNHIVCCQISFYSVKLIFCGNK